MENTATSWLLYVLTDSPLLLGIGGLFRTVPIVLFVLIGGAIADRFPRRVILLITQAVFIGASLTLGLLVLTDRIQPWHIYLFNFLNASLNAFDIPARQSLFPSLVRRDHLPSAVSLNAVAARTSMLLGPAVAGLAMVAAGNAAPFFLNAVSYLALVAALLAMQLGPQVAVAGAPLARHVGEGFGYVWKNPVLLPLLLVEALVSLFGHNNALLTIFARDVLHTGPEGLGLLRSSIGAGALLGMGFLIFGGEVGRKGRLMLAAGLIYAAALVGFSLSRSVSVSMLLLVVLGSSDALWNATRNTLAQLVSPDVMRGRIMSLVTLVGRGMTPLAEFQAGSLIAVFSPAGAGVFAGAVCAAAILVAATAARGLRGFSGLDSVARAQDGQEAR